MAGGVGSRFWPLSTPEYPKQFIDILGDGESLIQKTFRRFQDICPKENIYIITNKSYAHLVKEQLAGISDEQIVLEPARRTSPPMSIIGTIPKMVVIAVIRIGLRRFPPA